MPWSTIANVLIARINDIGASAFQITKLRTIEPKRDIILLGMTWSMRHSRIQLMDNFSIISGQILSIEVMYISPWKLMDLEWFQVIVPTVRRHWTGQLTSIIRLPILAPLSIGTHTIQHQPSLSTKAPNKSRQDFLSNHTPNPSSSATCPTHSLQTTKFTSNTIGGVPTAITQTTPSRRTLGSTLQCWIVHLRPIWRTWMATSQVALRTRLIQVWMDIFATGRWQHRQEVRSTWKRWRSITCGTWSWRVTVSSSSLSCSGTIHSR